MTCSVQFRQVYLKIYPLIEWFRQNPSEREVHSCWLEYYLVWYLYAICFYGNSESKFLIVCRKLWEFLALWIGYCDKLYVWSQEHMIHAHRSPWIKLRRDTAQILIAKRHEDSLFYALGPGLLIDNAETLPHFWGFT